MMYSKKQKPEAGSSSSMKQTRCYATESKVNEAHDQYANAEKVHLLQRIETHNGISSSRPMEIHASIRPSLP